MGAVKEVRDHVLKHTENRTRIKIRVLIQLTKSRVSEIM